MVELAKLVFLLLAFEPCDRTGKATVTSEADVCTVLYCNLVSLSIMYRKMLKLLLLVTFQLHLENHLLLYWFALAHNIHPLLLYTRAN